jgi:hypothetical protein
MTHSIQSLSHDNCVCVVHLGSSIATRPALMAPRAAALKCKLSLRRPSRLRRAMTSLRVRLGTARESSGNTIWGVKRSGPHGETCLGR